jgi:F-type H+-transporting ATPase subunit b
MASSSAPPRKKQAALGALALALVAAPAAAASGGLEIFPTPFAKSFGELFSLAFFTYPVVWLVALYTVLIWPANALIWRPLLRVLADRGERIAGTRARAEKIASQAQDVLASYQSAVERARRAADSDRAKVLENARTEQSQLTTDARRGAEIEVAAAREAVGAALGRARADLQAAAKELGREAAARVLGRPLS